MRHLWTTVTTEHTVTHDAGEPEWLDLPLDDLGFTLYNEEIKLGSAEEFYMPLDFTSEPVFAIHRLDQLWYTLPGLYTFNVRWMGSPACREVGQFSMIISDPSVGGYYD